MAIISTALVAYSLLSHQIIPQPDVALFKSLVGSWKGTCKTWLDPEKDPDEAAIEGEFTEVLEGKFIRHTYTSTFMKKPRKGEEHHAINKVTNKFEITWIDDFHMNYGIMFSEGRPTASGWSVTGKYATGPSTPAWSWRTSYDFEDKDTLNLTSYNISPEGKEDIAIEIVYKRVKK